MNKKRATYNISNFVLEEFERLASKAAVNKSRLVELLIFNWINDQKKSDEKKS